MDQSEFTATIATRKNALRTKFCNWWQNTVNGVQNAAEYGLQVIEKIGDPYRIRTCDHLLRRQVRGPTGFPFVSGRS